MASESEEPRVGWYGLAEWMETFRPDGVGRIVIDSGDQRDVIEFGEIVCDHCNGDAGNGHEDGTEGRLYFDGSDTLCETCGLGQQNNGGHE